MVNSTSQFKSNLLLSLNLTTHNTEAAIPTVTVVEKYPAVEKKSRRPEKPLAKINLRW
jgi:hypothetical protein